MAKDGTNRGGARIGAGAKKKPLADRIAEGNPGKRELTVIDFTESTVDLLQKFIRKHGTGCTNVAALHLSLRSFWSAMP